MIWLTDSTMSEQFNMGKEEEAQSGDVVDFEGDSDTHNPQNWPMGKKVYTTALWALTTCWITFASAIYSAGTAEISEEFHVSYEVANAGTSLLIFGFALGPMLWAPLCEVYGRKWPALAVSYPIAAATVAIPPKLSYSVSTRDGPC
jgi:hypothetical protein